MIPNRPTSDTARRLVALYHDLPRLVQLEAHLETRWAINLALLAFPVWKSSAHSRGGRDEWVSLAKSVPLVEASRHLVGLQLRLLTRAWQGRMPASDAIAELGALGAYVLASADRSPARTLRELTYWFVSASTCEVRLRCDPHDAATLALARGLLAGLLSAGGVLGRLRPPMRAAGVARTERALMRRCARMGAPELAAAYRRTWRDLGLR
jgi:hypothetical protein